MKLIHLTVLLIGARTWLIASFSLISIMKPLLLGLKVTTIFDDLNPKAFQSLALQMLHLSHCLFDSIKSNRNFVLSRSRMMLGSHLILQVLFINHDLIIVGKLSEIRSIFILSVSERALILASSINHLMKRLFC